MKLCNICCMPMIGAMSFSKDKRERFYRCLQCHNETKHQKIRDGDLDFGEILNRASNKKQ